MEGFSYVDIFATKGIEYLFVIGFLLVLIVFWRFLFRSEAVPIQSNAPARPVSRAGGWFQLIEGFHYHPGHSWLQPGEKNVVRIGVDDFAQKLIGKPGELKLPALGTRLKQGEKAWSLKVDSKSINMLSPVNGKVLRVNQEILNEPELINKDPYGEGWLLEVESSKLKTDLKNLLTGKLAASWMQGTVNALREKMSTPALGVVLQDGGLPVDGIAKSLDPERWEEIAHEFLLSG